MIVLIVLGLIVGNLISNKPGDIPEQKKEPIEIVVNEEK